MSTQPEHPNLIGAVTRGGHAVAGAHVVLRRPQGRALLETETDRSGEFSLVAPEGSWRIDITEGHEHAHRIIDVDARFSYVELDLDVEPRLRVV